MATQMPCPFDPAEKSYTIVKAQGDLVKLKPRQRKARIIYPLTIMNLNSLRLIFGFTFFTSCIGIPCLSQVNRIDSIITVLDTKLANKSLDSLTLSSCVGGIWRNPISKRQIEQLEKIELRLKKTNLNFPKLSIRYSILDNLIYHNDTQAIAYGQKCIESLESSKDPGDNQTKADLLGVLRFPFRNSSRLEEGIKYYSAKANKYKAEKDSKSLEECYFVLSGFHNVSGLIDLAIYNMKKSLSYIDSSKNEDKWLNNSGVLGTYYYKQGDYDLARYWLRCSFNGSYLKKSGFSFSALHLAKVMISTHKPDSAAYFFKIADADPAGQTPQEIATRLQTKAYFKLLQGELSEAEELIKNCWQWIEGNNLPVNPGAGLLHPDFYLAQIRAKQNRFEEAIALLEKDNIRLLNNRLEILRNYRQIADLYSRIGRHDKASENYSKFISLQDGLMAEQDRYRNLSFEAEQQMSENALAISKLESQNMLSAQYRNFSIGIAFLLLLLVAGLYNRFQTKKKANEILEKTLANLKSTQNQLIQAEKMASLGELTAGIAHEIQNPLNFVNNFSEVSNELLAEMKEELEKGNLDEVKEITNDVQQNLDKILHHGKRADAIVKGMLQHSRSSLGKKEPTDINALADEYLRLAYHGLRAKDKSFNAKMETNFDPGLGKINVIPQDIGRVMLNLITNAFYVVDEKKRRINLEGFQNLQGLKAFEPTVSVATKKLGDKIEIKVKDNGNGIPPNILDKIFQPFFTTKPTGQGTGLGLSLSYDIVKAHGGDLTVETKEGEGSTFTIQIPTP